MAVQKDKYEISLWEDYIVLATATIPEHYEEKKIAVIGSDNMTAQFRALEPRLVENINGTNTFTFKMFYTYVDNETGKTEQNPFINLLVNERKIKADWKGKWYDLVVKSIQEDSSGKSIVCTCKDLYINELSKTGFNIEFDDQLQNNQGTVNELAEKVLEGSDWRLGSSDIVKQKREEAVYEVTGVEINRNITASKEDGTQVTVRPTDTILLFYSVLQKEETYCQFLYVAGSVFTKEGSSQLVTNGDCLSFQLDSWDSTGDSYIGKKGGNPYLTIQKTKQVSNNYRAERLVHTQRQTLDPLTGKYVYLYDYSGNLVYGSEETVYKDPTVVNNILVNNKDFATTFGWSGNGISGPTLYPKFTAGTNASTYTSKTYLKFGPGTFLNSGIQKSISFLPSGFQSGEEYIVRFKAMSDVSGAPSGTYINTTTASANFKPSVSFYTLSGGVYTRGINYFTVGAANSVNGWIEFKLTCSKSATKSFLLSNDIGFFLVNSANNTNYWLEQIEFFPLIKDANNTTIYPGEMSKESAARVEYKYYKANQGWTSKEAIEYLHVGYERWNISGLTPKFNDNFEKIRTISAKNSNRFNLLQTLAETFQCWVRFTIDHDSTGKVIYTDGKPNKWVSFHSEVGERTGIGFVYGIDLKTISRTINSDQITSKIIVTPNNNSFARNGFCTIARSEENYAKENFILNFDYYISQGFLSLGAVNKDLYSSTNAIGYYYHLNKYNTEYDGITEEINSKKTELTKQQSLLTVYNQYITAAMEEKLNIESQIMSLANVQNMAAASSYISANPTNTKVIDLMRQRTNLLNTINQSQSQADSLKSSITNLQNYIETKEARQETLIESIKNKHQEFYNKYSRFIQEGSWSSEEYVDDNLYYLDAESTLYTSSRPQVSYDISVLRLSALEDFKNKVFKLGDISFIQDTDFFGYTYNNGIKTPYKEEILVSEIESNFDSPEKDVFKVQNYKTQFEDLFQRITSTTQSLQYSSGEYKRAASAFTETGEISEAILQNSFLLNQNLIISAQNESVVYDSTGITVSDNSNLNKKVKITSGGIFISTDGGTVWKNAIRGDGISTENLTSGSIYTNKMTIMDGIFTKFRWDSTGINAYYGVGEGLGVNLSKFVRFDQYGIYGINNTSGDPYDPNVREDNLEGENKIWRDANFGMTWKGFFMKNKDGSGQIEVSSENDIRIANSDDEERIKIGRIGRVGGTTGDYIYGIRISDGLGNAVFETSSDGDLWLKNLLRVGDGTNSTVSIGYSPTQFKESNLSHEVINAYDKFIVYEDGSLVATEAEITGTINAQRGIFTGSIYVGEGSNRITLDGPNRTIRSENYSADVSGWAINGNGFAEFQDVLVRGALKSTVFVYDEISAQGGTLMIAESSAVHSSFAKNDDSILEGLKVRKTYSSQPYLFETGDTLKIQTYIDTTTKIVLWLKVTDYISNDNEEYATYDFEILDGSTAGNYVIPAGTAIVNYGKNGTGYIIIRADDGTRGSYIKMVENTNTDIHVPGSQKTRLVLGDLTNESNLNLGTMSGYGLYAENVFLTGTIGLPNAGITDVSLAPEPKDNIRIWAGSNFADRENAPLRIYQDGRMIFKNKEGANVMILDPDEGFILGPDQYITWGNIENPPGGYEVIITGNHIKFGETGTTLGVQLIQDGINKTADFLDTDFIWYLNDVDMGTGKTKTFASGQINTSAEIKCIFTYN